MQINFSDYAVKMSHDKNVSGQFSLSKKAFMTFVEKSSHIQIPFFTRRFSEVFGKFSCQLILDPQNYK